MLRPIALLLSSLVACTGTAQAQAPAGESEAARAEWSIKPRGRLQIDAATVEAPDDLDRRFEWDGEVRRAFLGVEGNLPAGFGYRIEGDFAEGGVEPTDVYLSYEASDSLKLTLGHHKPFNGIEEMTSDLFLSMLERAAFTSAFGFERRLGMSGTWSRGDVLVQGGVFLDHIDDLEGSDSVSFDGRVVFTPRVGDGMLHIGISAHLRDLNETGQTVRYRARPFVHTTDQRLVDTGAIPATGERNFGLELAYLRGPFHVTVEGHAMTALRPGLDDPTFYGGYAEVGMLLTRGDTAAYKGGAYDRVRPARPVTEGGIGAIQLNARYDRLDLDNGAIAGGTQDALGLAAIWIPTERLRVLVNYGRLWIGHAAIPAGADSDYRVDTFGIRAQVDF